MKKSILFISCDEAMEICDRSQYGEASFWEKLKLNFRFCWCKMTRSYSKQNKKLTKIVKDSNVECLKEEERQDLHQTFDAFLRKQDQY
ncbi:hypothetical protein [Mangrovimonas sp. TPBH4]|uniref:hypothetical protein n=1 Tax=Mangrovimonas sp. TPBH4 TaxID=1645914 RepID=UPI0006B4DB2F|nr:hypothetical protein [Mangrovimonas sp. TPBH4]